MFSDLQAGFANTAGSLRVNENIFDIISGGENPSLYIIIEVIKKFSVF